MPRMSRYELERESNEKSSNRNGGNPHVSVVVCCLKKRKTWPYLYAWNSISARENDGRQFNIGEPTAPEIVESSGRPQDIALMNILKRKTRMVCVMILAEDASCHGATSDPGPSDPSWRFHSFDTKTATVHVIIHCATFRVSYVDTGLASAPISLPPIGTASAP